jgi:hypothetical protein
MATAVIRLDQRVPERSASTIHGEYYDEAGSALTVNSIRWGLYTMAGSVVNSLSDVSETASDSFDAVLNATDTAISTAGDIKRRMLIEVSYDSATYGSGLILNREVEFEIDNLQNIT